MWPPRCVSFLGWSCTRKVFEQICFALKTTVYFLTNSVDGFRAFSHACESTHWKRSFVFLASKCRKMEIAACTNLVDFIGNCRIYGSTFYGTSGSWLNVVHSLKSFVSRLRHLVLKNLHFCAQIFGEVKPVWNVLNKKHKGMERQKELRTKRYQGDFVSGFLSYDSTWFKYGTEVLCQQPPTKFKKTVNSEIFGNFSNTSSHSRSSGWFGQV